MCTRRLDLHVSHYSCALKGHAQWHAKTQREEFSCAESSSKARPHVYISLMCTDIDILWRYRESMTPVEGCREVWTERSAPSGIQWKWKYIFPKLPLKKRENIQLDALCLYSVTDQVTSDRITDFILRLRPHASSICDATACVGGNTLSFALCPNFTSVTSIEIDETRYQSLVHNCKVVGVEKKVVCLQGR